jgi:hypothetical protein
MKTHTSSSPLKVNSSPPQSATAWPSDKGRPLNCWCTWLYFLGSKPILCFFGVKTWYPQTLTLHKFANPLPLEVLRVELHGTNFNIFQLNSIAMFDSRRVCLGCHPSHDDMFDGISNMMGIQIPFGMDRWHAYVKIDDMLRPWLRQWQKRKPIAGWRDKWLDKKKGLD